MSNEAVKEQSDGSLSESTDGGVFTYHDPAGGPEGCCCCISDTITTRIIRSRGGSDPPWFMANGRAVPKCNRLYVWERRAVTANVYGGAQAPDYILKTLKGANGPFATFFGSGVLLDDEPYYWQTCDRGGYETLASMWFNVTLAHIEARRTTILDDGTYTLLAWVRFTHQKARTTHVDIVAENDGQVKLREVRHIRY